MHGVAKHVPSKSLFSDAMSEKQLKARYCKHKRAPAFAQMSKWRLWQVLIDCCGLGIVYRKSFA